MADGTPRRPPPLLPGLPSPNTPSGEPKPLLRERLSVRPRADGRPGYELEPLADELKYDKGLFVLVRAVQLLKAHASGVVVVGVAGPSGAGKTQLVARLGELTPVTVLSLDNYLDTSSLLDGNYDDPRLTDFTALTANLEDLVAGRSTEVPKYDFKQSRRVGTTRMLPPASGVLVLEGLYALHERLRPFISLSVAVTGGVHFDLIKRIQRDVARCGQTPQEILGQISETVFPCYKTYIEPDLRTAAVRIRNSYNPLAGLLASTSYTVKATAPVAKAAALAALQGQQPGSSEVSERHEETTDLFLLPPGEDAETCRDWIRLRLRDGKHSLAFEEFLSDGAVLIAPSIAFDVPVRTLGGLLTLGYSLGCILKRSTEVLQCGALAAKWDDIPQIAQNFFQIEGRDRAAVEAAAAALDLQSSLVPRSYIELVQLGRLARECLQPSLDDLRSALPAAAAAALAGGSGVIPTSPGGTRLHTRLGGREGARRALQLGSGQPASPADWLGGTPAERTEGPSEASECARLEAQVTALESRAASQQLGTELASLKSAHAALVAEVSALTDAGFSRHVSGAHFAAAAVAGAAIAMLLLCC